MLSNGLSPQIYYLVECSQNKPTEYTSQINSMFSDLYQVVNSLPNNNNFRLVQIESIFRRQTKCELKLEICIGKGIFSFSHIVFNRLLSQSH